MNLSETRKFIKNNKDAIINDYLAGKTLSEVGKKYGFSYGTIQRVLARSDVQKRNSADYLNKKRSWSRSVEDEVKELYLSGLSAEEIGKKYKKSAKPIYTILRRLGVDRRDASYYAAGEKNYFWKGGTIVDKHGYILVHAPEHPHRTANNKVREHRLIMEKKLGRYLRPEEVVDHINGKKSDNRPENLRVYKNNAAHLAATLKGKRPNWSKEGKRKLKEQADKRRGVPVSEW